jgi:diguanylate cyclase (GGDEF)-like protein
LLVLWLLALPFAYNRATNVAGLIPAMMVMGGLADLATAGLVLLRYRRAPRRSLGFLGIAFIGLALLSFLMTIAFPLGLDDETLLKDGLTAMGWLYPTWAVLATLVAFIYLGLANSDARRPSSPAFLCLAALGVVLLEGGLAAGFSTLVHGLAAAGIAQNPLYGPPPAFALALALAFLALAFRGRLQGLDAWLRLALLAIVLDSALNTLSVQTYQVSWYVGRAFYLLASLLVFAGAVRDLLAWEDRAVRAEADVERETGIVRQHARRLETLWRVASASATDDASYLRALLGAASTVLQEGHAFFASIQHLEGRDFVVDVSLGSPGSRLLLQEGSRHPAAEMLAGQLLRAPPTSSWADVLLDPVLAATRGARRHGIRAFVGTIFNVGPTVYALSLASPVPLDAPLDSLDHAFVETLAALCATRLQQRSQFDRLVYQTEHDTLTAVLTRAAFRARGAAALATGEPFALVVLDLNGFRSVNEEFGQQTGDALLVEVAAMLASHADGDVVARLSADHFALLMLGVAGPAEASHALARYLRGFDEPFTTGTFGTVREVRLSATCGIALAPADGKHVDELLAHANRALDDAQVVRRRGASVDSKRASTERGAIGGERRETPGGSRRI